MLMNMSSLVMIVKIKPHLNTKCLPIQHYNWLNIMSTLQLFLKTIRRKYLDLMPTLILLSE